MTFNRIGRILVCLLLVCCLTFHVMFPRADATGLGATAVITAASTVLTPATLVIGATLIALGIYAGADPEGFESICSAAQSALESASTWIKDGTMELLRTVDSAGNARYYVDSGLVESVRNWVCDEDILLITGTISSGPYIGSYISPAFLDYLEKCYSHPYYFVSYSTFNHYWYCGYSDTSPFEIIYEDNKSSYTIYTPDGSIFKYYTSTASSTAGGRAYSLDYMTDVNPSIPAISTQDIAVGNFPVFSVDGTSARYWSEEYTDSGLKVYSGGSGNNNNDGKWFWPLALTLTVAELYAMSQADQWAAQTPAEFDDYTEVEVLEIVSRPEVDFAQGVEFAPVTSPTPDTGGNTGSDTGSESGNQIDYTSWFQKIIKGIEELPSKFESWIMDCKTAIEELPSKLADWFNNLASKLERIFEGITTLGQNIGYQLQTMGQSIVDGIKNALSTLFSPSPDYFANKVEELKANHYNIDKFTQLGNDFKLFFSGLGTQPPIIWIDLGAATGSYLWGGKQIFLDLTWYSQYKSKMDFILGAIIWLWLAWRVFLSVPGIINGASGVWGKYHRGGSRDDN